VNSTLFVEYVNSIFVCYFNDLEETGEFEACEAVFLMDNSSSHMSDDVTAILTHERVHIIIFTSHMTDIFQLLDVNLFGALKKHAMSFDTVDKESRVSRFVFNVYRDFKQTMVEVNILAGFATIGFIHDTDQIRSRRLFKREKFRESPSFVELREDNIPSNSFSERQRDSKFG
jgi:hypothetical protein